MRLVDADELKQAEKRISNLPWGDWHGNKVEFTWTSQGVQRLIDKSPTIDAVEVVRCKECKHRYGDECPMRYVEWVTYDDDGYIEWDDVVHDHTMDDGFCNCGEREDGEA